jgi:hypothetical protein
VREASRRRLVRSARHREPHRYLARTPLARRDSSAPRSPTIRRRRCPVPPRSSPLPQRSARSYSTVPPPCRRTICAPRSHRFGRTKLESACDLARAVSWCRVSDGSAGGASKPRPTVGITWPRALADRLTTTSPDMRAALDVQPHPDQCRSRRFVRGRMEPFGLAPASDYVFGPSPPCGFTRAEPILPR